jgi:hypothetical protein
VASTDVNRAGAAVASTKACMATAGASAMSAASVTSAMLRPERHGQEKRERRDDDQAAHT